MWFAKNLNAVKTKAYNVGTVENSDPDIFSCLQIAYPTIYLCIEHIYTGWASYNKELL